MTTRNEKFKDFKFIIVKADHIENIKQGEKDKFWAVPHRNNCTPDQQPIDKLNALFKISQKVLLIISVSGTKRYQGYGYMKGYICEKSLFKREGTSQKLYKFDVEWTLVPNVDSGNGLSFDLTKDLTNKLIDPSNQKNKINHSRNADEIDEENGVFICSQIDKIIKDHHLKIELKKQEEERALKHIFTISKQDSESFDQLSSDKLWRNFLKEVEKVGKVLSATQIGSRCYNLFHKNSDIDLLVIVVVRTENFSSLDGVQNTVKNNSGFEPDFTIHEVGHFCELILSGDPRMIEILWKTPQAVAFTDPFFQKLIEMRKEFMTKDMLCKYISEVQDTKGKTKLRSLKNRGESNLRICKHYYILLRLISNGIEIAKTGSLTLWLNREEGLGNFLLDVRQEKYSLEELEKILEEKVQVFQELISNSNLPQKCLPETISKTNRWLEELRFNHFSEPQRIQYYNSLKSKQTPREIEFLKKYQINLSFVPKFRLLSIISSPSSPTVPNFIVYLDKEIILKLGKIETNPVGYELKNMFINILHRSNPNHIWPLFVPNQYQLYSTPQWELLVQNRNLFINQETVKHFISFMDNDLKNSQKKKKPKKLEPEKLLPLAVFLKLILLNQQIEDISKFTETFLNLSFQDKEKILQDVLTSTLKIDLSFLPKSFNFEECLKLYNNVRFFSNLNKN